MIEEIQIAIEKNLPEAIGKELNKIIEDNECLRERLKIAEDGSKYFQERLDKLSQENKKLKENVKSEKYLQEKESELTRREYRMELTLAENKAKMSEEKYQSVKGLVSQVFRNKEIMRTTTVNESKQYEQIIPNDSHTNTIYSNDTTTTEVHETEV